LRNFIFLHALEHGLPLPIGTQDSSLLDTRLNDEDVERTDFIDDARIDEAMDEMLVNAADLGYGNNLRTEEQFRQRADAIYTAYQQTFSTRFKWLSAALFNAQLAKDLRKDARSLIDVLRRCGQWDWQEDTKLQALLDLVTIKHAGEKVLIFTQFADTVHYLECAFQAAGISAFAGATGGDSDPTQLAWRFSPDSNGVRNQIRPDEDLRVLVATDVLSEGQNLQDGCIVINYDLPWAIVRLIQRAGRVDRIGQHAENILCYSFLPADGVERILRLRARVRQRLQENAEVVGTDEAFFDDDQSDQVVVDLYNEKAGILDGEEDTEVDLASYAYQIWKNAIAHNPSLQQIIPDLPPVAFSTKSHLANPLSPDGVLTYIRTGDENDALAWIDPQGNSVTESQFEILKAAECAPDTPAIPRQENHHELVRKAVELVQTQERATGGQLGRPSGARFRTYEKLKHFIDHNRGTLWITQELLRAVEEIYRFPLRETARDILNRQLRSGIDDHPLAELVVSLRAEDRLCIVEEETEQRDPQIICSLGLAYPGGR
jgi:hypothetical protein